MTDVMPIPTDTHSSNKRTLGSLAVGLLMVVLLIPNGAYAGKITSESTIFALTMSDWRPLEHAVENHPLLECLPAPTPAAPDDCGSEHGTYQRDPYYRI